MKPVSDNLIFFDTEFSSLDPAKGEILSIGMVKPGGEELYLEVEYPGEVSPWVREHVLPALSEAKVSREEAKARILAFAGANRPYLMSYVIEYDALYLYKLLGVNEEEGNRSLPFHWIVLDFASLMVADGIPPEKFMEEKWLLGLGIDSSRFRKHHALDDARLLRDAYLKLTAGHEKV